MKLTTTHISKIQAALKDTTDAQVGRLRMLVEFSSVDDEIKTEFMTVLDNPETQEDNMTILLTDALAAPGMDKFIESKVTEAKDALQVTVDGLTTQAADAVAAHKAILIDAIVVAATALRDGIDPLEFDKSQKTFKDSLLEKEVKDLQTQFDALQAKVNELGQAPIVPITSDQETNTDGESTDDSTDENNDEEVVPVEYKDSGDVLKSYIDQIGSKSK